MDSMDTSARNISLEVILRELQTKLSLGIPPSIDAISLSLRKIVSSVTYTERTKAFYSVI